jgi:DNA-binding NtrC family response regulator
MEAGILLLETEEATRAAVLAALPKDRLCQIVSSTAEAEAVLDAREVKVLLCSDNLPDETGLMFLARTRDKWPCLRRILLAPELDGELFFHAMREVSLFDYLAKPIVPSELQAAVVRACAQFDAARRLGHQAGHEPEILHSAPDPHEEIPPPPKNLPRDGALFVIGYALGALSVIVILAVLYTIKSHFNVDIYPLLHFHNLFD